MSDELDPQLLRMFARASEPLSDAEFQARLMDRLQRARGWRGLPQSAWSALLAICSGVATGVAAPFRFRIGMARLIAILLGAAASCIAMLSV